MYTTYSETPIVELLITFQQFGKPKTQTGRQPTATLPYSWHTRIENIIQGIAQLFAHDDGTLYGKQQVFECRTHENDDLHKKEFGFMYI